MKLFYALFLSLFLSIFSAHIFADSVDLNTADAKALSMALKGVGPKTAQAIVEYRTKHGPFKNVDELAKVKGIGEKTVTKNRNSVHVGKPKK